MKKSIRSILGILTLSGALMGAGSAKALSSQMTVSQSFTIDEHVSIEITNPGITVNGLLPGQYADSNIVGVRVATNLPYGYTLISTVGDHLHTTRDLVDTKDLNNVFASLAVNSAVAELNSFEPDTWGYSFSTDNQATWSSYSGLPLYTDTANVATLKDTDDGTDKGTVFFKIGAKASNTKTAGTYDNVVTFAATVKPKPEPTCAAGYICYNGNGAEANFGGMAPQEAAAGDTVTLRAANFKHTGYGFVGWSLVDTPNIGTDKIYGPMETITVPAAASGQGLNLYAVWLRSSGDMQSFTNEICESMDKATVTYDNTSETNDAVFTVTRNTFKALTDVRDGNVYTIARLTDGNCWMLENLRLDENVSAENIAAYSQNGVGGTFTKLAPSDSSLSVSWSGATANSLYSTGAAATMPRYMSDNTTNSTTNFAGATSGDAANNYSYGNYYSWAAAKASTVAMNSAAISDNEENSKSICPTNWRLPKGTASGDFAMLSTSMGGNAANMTASTTPKGAILSERLRQFPNNVLYAGYRSTTSVGGRGTGGNYWSSTANTATNAYRLYLASTLVYPGTAPYNKYLGFSVRCVAGS